MFVARAGKTYTILRRDSVDHGSWLPIADVPATSFPRPVTVRVATPAGLEETQHFYRLVTPRLAR